MVLALSHGCYLVGGDMSQLPLRQLLFNDSTHSIRLTFEVRIVTGQHTMILDRKRIYAIDMKEAQDTQAYGVLCQQVIDLRRMLHSDAHVGLYMIHNSPEEVLDPLIPRKKKGIKR